MDHTRAGFWLSVLALLGVVVVALVRPGLMADEDDGDEAQRRLEQRLAALETRLEALTRSTAPPLRGEALVREAKPAPTQPHDEASPPEPRAPTTPTNRPEDLQALGRLLVRSMQSDADPAQYAQMSQLLARVNAEAWIQSATQRVEADPEDAEAHMQLARAYLARLMRAAGPEQGTWGVKAEAQWKRVLELDPEHVEARRMLATSYSYYPDAMNKVPDAIQHFETLREQLRGRTPQADDATVYVQLALLHLRRGNRDEAQSVLDEGDRRHPDHPGIRKTRESLK